ncbi:hypothetical protein EV126DRAFT_117964 [Verticillium dahliae]|nr:hypothetical protein EV126DRAFT_161125 [Verticillium dahliae]KAH6689279.1 hypothetical protein EV126DRAFT_117964 [Verticillium dahliae]
MRACHIHDEGRPAPCRLTRMMPDILSKPQAMIQKQTVDAGAFYGNLTRWEEAWVTAVMTDGECPDGEVKQQAVEVLMLVETLPRPWKMGPKAQIGVMMPRRPGFCAAAGCWVETWRRLMLRNRAERRRHRSPETCWEVVHRAIEPTPHLHLLHLCRGVFADMMCTCGCHLGRADAQRKRHPCEQSSFSDCQAAVREVTIV